MKHKSHRPHGAWHLKVSGLCKASGCSEVAIKDGYCKICYQFYNK